MRSRKFYHIRRRITLITSHACQRTSQLLPSSKSDVSLPPDTSIQLSAALKARRILIPTSSHLAGSAPLALSSCVVTTVAFDYNLSTITLFSIAKFTTPLFSLQARLDAQRRRQLTFSCPYLGSRFLLHRSSSKSGMPRLGGELWIPAPPFLPIDERPVRSPLWLKKLSGALVDPRITLR